jgi:hypothetical protein
VSERLRRARRGVRGGAGGVQGGPPARGFFFAVPLKKNFAYFRDDIFPGPHDI